MYMKCLVKVSRKINLIRALRRTTCPIQFVQQHCDLATHPYSEIVTKLTRLQLSFSNFTLHLNCFNRNCFLSEIHKNQTQVSLQFSYKVQEHKPVELSIVTGSSISDYIQSQEPNPCSKIYNVTNISQNFTNVSHFAF